jgi:acyl-[acyl-carrier-protein]-phospholipid O-acyltransferase/long-chain-fatty-acid--[acyl-carrier-protein] ligase
VIPVYIDEMWGSIFSFERGRFFRKWPLRLPYPISIHVDKPVEKVHGIHQARQDILKLGANAVKKRQHGFMSLPSSAVRNCKKRKFRSKIADSSGANLSGAQCLLRALVLRRLLRRHVLGPEEKNVGVFLPPSVGGVLTNLALTLDKRVAINLNYTVSSNVLNECISTSGIKHVLTSRRFMSKMDFDLDTELVYLEDFKDKPTLADKVSSALAAYVTPASWLEQQLGLGEIKGDDVLTVIFTSGSTGAPKGVMLTFDNIASNAEAIDQVIHLGSKDVIVGVLPFFHSFGYTVTLWTPLALDLKGIYHYSPIDGKRIGKLAAQHKATVMLATPTFLRNYLRRCTPEQFKTLDVIVTGAEKLPKSLADAFEEKFGVRPVEGYGCTELSPLASVNVPLSRNLSTDQKGLKDGTVGRPVPGVAARIVDLETGAECDVNEEGMLQISGPNVMKGYLRQPEKTAEVIKDGWYVTGDVALIDNEGFVQITGRESRFSKIGGEMVPHIQIEDALNELIGADEEAGLKAVVTAVPDERKGERLIVLHTDLDKTPEDLRDGLTQMGLPNLYIPAANGFVKVDEIPVLGTGKLDLQGMKDKALELVGKA